MDNDNLITLALTVVAIVGICCLTSCTKSCHAARVEQCRTVGPYLDQLTEQSAKLQAIEKACKPPDQ